MPTMLIADDNAQITSVLAEYGKQEGYDVLVARDGQQALDLFSQHQPDVVLLDVMMPRVDGFEVCRTIRKTADTPVIMITARGEDFEKIMGLDIGADDYIVKPFSPGEVMARVRSVLRRMARADSAARQVKEVGGLMVDLDNYRAAIDGQTIALTKKELELLWTLATSPGRVLSRENLLNALWGYDYFGDSRTVDSHIKRLRAKLDRHAHAGWDIKTIWGVGYSFEVVEHEA